MSRWTSRYKLVVLGSWSLAICSIIAMIAALNDQAAIALGVMAVAAFMLNWIAWRLL